MKFLSLNLIFVILFVTSCNNEDIEQNSLNINNEYIEDLEYSIFEERASLDDWNNIDKISHWIGFDTRFFYKGEQTNFDFKINYENTNYLYEGQELIFDIEVFSLSSPNGNGELSLGDLTNPETIIPVYEDYRGSIKIQSISIDRIVLKFKDFTFTRIGNKINKYRFNGIITYNIKTYN